MGGDLIVAEEREAIVAWAVQAMPRLLQANEYTLPKSHHETIYQIVTMNNSVRMFLLESAKVRIVPDQPEEIIAEKKLYALYWSFCLGPAGLKPVGLRDFQAKMRELAAELGFEVDTETTELGGQQVTYRGLMLLDATGRPAGEHRPQMRVSVPA